MRTIRKHKGNWQCLVRIKDHPHISKSFKKHDDAKRWRNEIELKIRREYTDELLQKPLCDEQTGKQLWHTEEIKV